MKARFSLLSDRKFAGVKHIDSMPSSTKIGGRLTD